MLRTNLSTRPFYNERAVHLLLALAALIVARADRLQRDPDLSLSRQNTELSSLINRDHEEAAAPDPRGRSASAPASTRTSSRPPRVGRASPTALIDQRTFSWTEFFNHIEETLPPDVMLSSVRPNFSDDKITIAA